MTTPHVDLNQFVDQPESVIASITADAIPVQIWQDNKPIANLVSPSYVAEKEQLEVNHTMLIALLDDQQQQILALQRLLTDDGSRLSDHEVRGAVLTSNTEKLTDEWT